jgi:phage-related protein
VAAEVGSAFISIRPSLVGFHKQIAKDLKSLGPQIIKIGQGIGADFRKGFETGLGDTLSGPLDDSTKRQQSKAPKQGDQVAGAFAKGFSNRLKAAFAALPKAEIDADSSAADKKIYELRARLEELAGSTIGVDIDSKTALAELEAIRVELSGLGDNAPIEVKADVGAALTQIGMVQAAVAKVDGTEVDIDTRKSGRSLLSLRGILTGLAPAFGSVASSGVAGFGQLSLAAGWLGVAILAVGAIAGGVFAAVGAAVAGVGAGFLGLGVLIAAQNTQVKKAFTDTFAGIQKQAQSLAKPFIGPLKQVAGIIGTTFQQIAPTLGRIFKTLAPALVPLVTGVAGLVKSLMPLFSQMATIAAPMLASLGTALKNFGPQLAAFFTPMLSALKSTGASLFPTLIGGVGRLLAALGPLFGVLVEVGAQLLGPFLDGLTTIASALVSLLVPVVRAVAPVFLQIVGVLKPLVTQLAAALLPVVMALTPVLGLLVGALAQIVVAVLPILPPLSRLITTLIGALAPVLQVVLVVLAKVIAVIATVLVPVINVLTRVVSVVAPVLGAVFGAIKTAVLAVGAAAMWLWKTVLVPAFNAISLAARIMFAVLATIVLAPLLILFNLVKAVVLVWWHNVVVPAFAAVQVAASAMWSVIHPVLNAFVVAARAVGSAAMWLWRNAVVPAWNGIAAVIGAVVNHVIKPELAVINAVIRNVIAPVFRWLYTNVIKPQFQAAGLVIRTVWNTVISPAFDALKRGVSAVQKGFSVAVSAIGKIWKGLESATKKPVQFVVNTVYNSGIRSVWNKVADLVHLPQLPAVKFARGGINEVLPGYTPGRDPHQFYSPTGGRIDMSGGEAIMRPEFTRAVGPGFVYAANKVARKRGAGGVRDWLANGDMKFARGGVFPGGPVQSFAFGGILDAVKHAGSLVVHGASSLLDAGASAFAKHALDPILGRIPGGDSTFARAIYSLPKRMIDGFLSFLKNSVDPKLGGDGLGVVAQAKKFVGVGDDRGPNNNMWTRAWGMPGAPWCAMFVSDMIKRAGATKHYPGYPTAAVAGYNGAMRHVPTGSGQAGDLGVYGGGAHINIIAGKKGGAYDTYGGNQNAVVQHKIRGGQTSVLRPRFAYGGILGRQAQRVFKYEAPRNADPHELQTPLVRLMRSLPAGQMGHVARAIVRQNLDITNAGVYDDGGIVPPGLNLIANASRKPEAVLNGSQWAALTSAAGSGGTGDSPVIGTVVLSTPEGATPREVVDELTFGVRNARRGGAYARG